MKLSKTQLTEMVRRAIREQLTRGEKGMTPAEIAAHLQDKKEKSATQKKRSAMKATSRGMDECGCDDDMDDSRPKKHRRLSDVFADESVNEGLYEEAPGGMDEFTTRYIETALWSSTDESDEESGGEPLDKNYSVDDIDDDALTKMQRDCNKFQEMAGEMIDGRESDAGHDFWLTRNGHGAGFWDGDWPEHEDALTDLAHKFGEVDLYVGDDNTIYSYGG